MFKGKLFKAIEKNDSHKRRSKSTIDDFRSNNKESTIFSFTENCPSLKVKKLNGHNNKESSRIEFKNSRIQNGLRAYQSNSVNDLKKDNKMLFRN